ITLRELINFSRPASTSRDRVSLGDIMEEALNIAKYYKRTKGRGISAQVPADLPPLVGVRDQLVQVFLNLILNAIDATENGGQITISAKALNGIIRVQIRDNGCGIAPADAKRIFEPYFTTKRHGTGLGLFVTRKLAEEHGGSVAFESKPAEGTIFWVQLPCLEEVNRRAS